MPSLSFPRELIDIIIDHLHYDRLALAACCLVCKAWLPSSRYHLLSDVRIDYLTAQRILGAETLSTTAPYVRRLMLCHLYPLPARIDAFSSITSLFIYGCLPYEQMRYKLPSLFPHTTYLELSGTKFQTAGEMLELSCAFPELQALTLSCAWEDDILPREEISPLPTLHTVNLWAGAHAILPWLTRSMPPCLSTLRLFKLMPRDIPFLVPALRAAGKSLTRLELGFSAFRDAAAFLGKISLCHSPSVRVFMLHNAPSSLLQSLLKSAIPNTRLQEAHLITGIWEKAAHRNFQDSWADLDEGIANPAGTQCCLTNLTFRLDTARMDFQDRIMEEMKGCLPLCTARGIVRFVSERERAIARRKRTTGPISTRSLGDTLVY